MAAAAALPPAASSGYPGNPGSLLLPTCPCLSVLAEDKAMGAQGETGFVLPGCFLPLRSATFFTPLEITGQVAAGFFPEPSPAPHAGWLAVKCAEVTFPPGIRFLTKPRGAGGSQELGCARQSSPMWAELLRSCHPLSRGTLKSSPWQGERRKEEGGRRKEGCSSGRRISPRRGFSRSRQGDPSVHPQSRGHPPEPGERSSAHSHAPEQLPCGSGH